MVFRLVVVLAVGEHDEFVEVFVEPRSRLRNANKTVFDDLGLGVQAHDLVGGRLISSDSVATIGDHWEKQVAGKPVGGIDDAIARIGEPLGRMILDAGFDPLTARTGRTT